MNGNAASKAQHERTFNLSEVLNNRVMLHGRKIGKLNDMIIAENGRLPEITCIVVRRPFGNPTLMVPWDRVRSFTDDEVVIDVDDLRSYQGEPGEQALLLRDHVLDKKILDLEDTEVEIVYDLQLVLVNNRMYVSAVDSSRYGRWRRLGFRRTADLRQAADRMHENMIPWTYVQPLSPSLTSFKGEVKLKILKEKLSDMQPADVADILEELDHEQRVIVFNQLDSEHASDTLEEIDPNVQRELVSSLSKDKVAELINQMSPGQAADLIGALPHDETEDILPRLSRDLAAKVHAIMDRQEEGAINYATLKFIRVHGDMTADEVQNDYPSLAKGKLVVMYFYVVDDDDTLLGVLDIKDILEAPDDAKLRDIMISNVVSLRPDSTLREAAGLFARYDFRALPLIDDRGRIIGVVPYRDVMRLTHHFVE